MKRLYLLLCIAAALSARAQNVQTKTPVLTEREIIAQARAMGIPEADIKGYVAYRKSLQLQAKEKLSPLKVQEPDSSAATCFNMGFEAGSFTGWTGRTGTNVNGTGYFSSRYIVNGRHTIVKAGTDPLAGTALATVCPWGGNNSVRLGNGIAGAEAEQLQRSFLVTNENKYFTYSYAVVTERSEHPDHIHAFFVAEMIDESGKLIPCSFDTVRPNSQGVIAAANSNIVFKPWTSRTVDLSGYIGKRVTLRFTTGDCSLGGHFAYAYVDAACLEPSQTKSICGSPAILSAPQGAASYVWSTGDKHASIQTSQPGSYAVTVEHFNGCPVTIGYTVSQGYVPAANFTAAVSSATVTFTNASTGTKPSYTWDFGDGTSSAASNPLHTYSNPGVYIACLTVTDSTGCSSSMCQAVSITNTGSTTDVKDADFNDLLSIYPNPSNDGLFSIDLSKYDLKKVKLSVYDIIGNTVYERELSSSSNIDKHLIDLSAEPSGNYFLTVQAETGMTTKRLWIK